MAAMEASACAIGRLRPGGPWIGFGPSLDDSYELVVEGVGRAPATPLDLLCLVTLYFEDSLDEPPEELAATHGDIGALVRHVAAGPHAPVELRARVAEVVDAIDDGLAADVVITRLQAALGPGLDPRSHVAGRAGQMSGGRV
jgi:hypothetical protein